MNLLLLRADELSPDGLVRLGGRRLDHLRDVLRVQRGQTLRVGIRGGGMGTAEVVSEDTLLVRVTEDPPPRANVSLVLAIPRPKQLKRVIPAVASLGVDRVVLVGAARVEKSYFDSKVLTPEFLDSLVDLGLEQACDTLPPAITLHRDLRAFLRDELPTWAPSDAERLVPHPYATEVLSPRPSSRSVVLAIGPDGGFIPDEIALFERCGFGPVSLGRRVLRCEVAVPAVLGALRAATG